MQLLHDKLPFTLADLTICDREPIHAPGHVQPHGLLVATAPDGLRISHVSLNASKAIGLKAEALLGTNLVDLVGSAGLAAMEQALLDISYAPANVLRLTLPIPLNPLRKVLVHRHLGRMIVELEDHPRQDESGPALLQAQSIIASLRKTRTTAELCDQTAQSVRQLTGFDRVMVYRFDQDGHGSVIAEDKALGLESFLHLHYPASDIPQQARRLYIMQRVRNIADVNYRPVQLISNDGTELDMSLCALRGVSPVHLEYLRNMGVGGSFSISLMRDDALWGMIIGHHIRPHHVTVTLRAVCDIIGQLVSMLLQRVEETESLAIRIDRSGIIHTLRNGIDLAENLADSLHAQSDAVLKLMDAGGALIRCDGQTRLIGNTPPSVAAGAITDALLLASGGEICADADAGKPGGIAEGHSDTASGVLAMPLTGDPTGVIAWFRPETAQNILWAGDPRKQVCTGSTEAPRIIPRQSFAAWAEIKHGCSEPWTKSDLQAAEHLQRDIALAMLFRTAAGLPHFPAFDPQTGLPVQAAPVGQINAIEKSQALIEFALDGTILRANENFAAAVGYGVEELRAKNHRLLVDPFLWDSPEYLKFWDCLGKGEHQGGEYRRIRKDGSEVWFQATYNPVFGRDGKPYKIVKLATDTTTHRVQASELVAQAEAIARSQAVIEFDMSGNVLAVNEKYLAMLGYESDEVVGQHHRLFLDPTYGESTAYSHFWDALRKGEYQAAEFKRVGKDGKEAWLQASYNPILDSKGVPYKVVKIATDITARKLAETRVVALQAEFRALLDSPVDAKLRLFEGVVLHTTDGVLITEAEPRGRPGPRIVYANPAFTAMTGYSAEEVIGKTPRILQGPLTDQAALDQIRRALATWQPVRVEVLNYNKDGIVFWVELSISPICDERGWNTHWLSVQRDITERKRLEQELQLAAERLQHAAYHDTLTGLPNRRLLVDRIEQAIAMASRHDKKLAVLFIDLDGFKHINDSLGHGFGDRLLISVCCRLAACVRDSDTVSRQGGDEFVALMSEMNHPEDAVITARRILQAVAEPHVVDGHDLHVTASIGISVYPNDGLDSAVLIKAADTAMYKVKASGRHGYQFFEHSMKSGAVERQHIEEGLRRALRNGEFVLHYQPKINIASGAITGAEALIRWTDAERGSIAPALFIPVAENCGLIRALGSWVLREACEQGRRWIEAGLKPITLAVNVSPLELGKDDFLGDVRRILDDTGFDPHFLELEMTEGVLMKNVGSTNATFKALKAMGTRLAIDDFGTGYSSLSYLTKFPIDTIKIDQSFVRHISADPTETAIITAVIGMAHSLKLDVVAEGVETLEELEFLSKLGCGEAQGYYFSRPIPVQPFTALLANTATIIL